MIDSIKKNIYSDLFWQASRRHHTFPLFTPIRLHNNDDNDSEIYKCIYIQYEAYPIYEFLLSTRSLSPIFGCISFSFLSFCCPCWWFFSFHFILDLSLSLYICWKLPNSFLIFNRF